MKILVVSNLYPPDTLGGYEMGCRQVVEALQGRGHEVRVLTTAPRTPVESPGYVSRSLRLVDTWNHFIQERSTPVTRQLAEAESLRVNAFNVHTMLGAIEDFAPDVVYVWMVTGVGGLGLLGCLQYLQVPWVWHLMDEVPPILCQVNGRLVPALAAEFERQLQGQYISCSRQLVLEIERQGVCLGSEVEVIANWVTGELPPVRQSFERGEMLRIVAAAAHLNRGNDKGIEHLIGAAAILRARGHERFRIDLYGQVSDHYFRDMIRAADLHGTVRLMGGRSQAELMRAYYDYDVFAFPARPREPFGFAPLEATPTGCVPILARTCGIAEWLVHGVHCLKVERSAEGFAGALEAVLDGLVDLEAIGRRASAVVRRDFHLDTQVLGIERVLEKAARRPRSNAGTPAEAYRLALLAEKLSHVLIQEPYVA